MKEKPEVDGLHEIYKQADAENRKKIVSAAVQLLEAQKIMKNEEGIDKKKSGKKLQITDIE